MMTSLTSNSSKTDYPVKIIFICLGNICRSPAAEGIMKKLVADKQINDKYHIESAGIGGWHVGELPDKRMRKHASLRGFDLNSRAQQFEDSFFNKFDYIVVMDNENYKNISNRTVDDEQRSKIVKIRDCFIKHNGCQSVPDPYYGGEEDFELALDLIEDGCQGLLNMIENK